MIPFTIGVLLAPAVAAFGRAAGLDRDRAFYPVTLIVVASYYVLFAAVGGSMWAVAIESAVMAAFVAAAVAGFKRSLWLVSAALVAHGLFDLLHHRLIDNAGVPAWWPVFCMAYDIGAGATLAWLLGGLPRREGVAAFRF